MNGRPRILHLITDLRPGGEARLLLAYLPEFARAGVENTVCCLAPMLGSSSSTETDLIPAFEAAGIRVVNLRATKRTLPLAAARLFALLRRERPDILHTYLFHPNVLGRAVGRLAGVPVVVSSVVSVDDWKRWHHVLLERLTAPMARSILVNAVAVRDRLVTRDRVSGSRLMLSYNGVKIAHFESAHGELRRELGIDRSTQIVGTICRLHRAKALDRLLRAFAALAGRVDRAVLVIAGDGPQREDLAALAEQLGIANRTFWLGVRDDVPAVIRDFDVFVISSDWEGIPGTIFESMAARVPIVATRVGGIPEVLEHGVNASLVDAGSHEELAAAIARVLQDRSLAARLVERAAADVRNRFSFERAAKERLDWYARLLADRQGVSVATVA